MAGRIIVLSGTSSAGKSSLAKALREDMPEAFCYYTTDQLTDGYFAPITKAHDNTYHDELTAFYRGFNRSIVAFADAGNDIMVELVVENPEWGDDLKAALSQQDVFWIWVYAPEEELQRREIDRDDRRDGTALNYLKTKDYLSYDLEVDTSQPMAENVLKLSEAWRSRKPPGQG